MFDDDDVMGIDHRFLVPFCFHCCVFVLCLCIPFTYFVCQTTNNRVATLSSMVEKRCS